MLPGIPLCTEWLDIPVGKNPEGRTQGTFPANRRLSWGHNLELLAFFIILVLGDHKVMMMC
jgi:hypothetical protein